MIVVMSQGASSNELENVKDHLSKRGLKVHLSEGIERTVVGVIGQIYPELQGELELMDGVGEVVRISKPYKLASREFKSDDTVISIGDTGVKIGGGEFVVFGGPCAIENRDHAMSMADKIATICNLPKVILYLIV